MAERLIQTETLKDIADAIKAKTGGTASITPLDMPSEIASIPSGGLPDNYFKANPYMSPSQGLVGLFYGSSLPDEITLDFNNVAFTSLYQTFGANLFSVGAYGKKINLIGDTSLVTTFFQAFLYRTNLEEINGILDFSSTTPSNNNTRNAFNSNNKLAEIRVAGIKNTIQFPLPELSLESLASIVNALADLTGGTAQTVTIHATAKAKLTSEQIAEITAKNWTLA